MPNQNRGSCGFQPSEFEQQYERPSKSQMKRDMTALQKMGEYLVDQSRERIKNAPLPEDLADAILFCQSIRDHEGRRRQLQYVGKLMRGLEPEEVATIQNTIDSWRGLSKADTAKLHAVERQREKLLASDDALTQLLQRHPTLDVQHLRNLIRNARREQAESKPPKAYREIFQVLKALEEQNDSNQDHDDE